MGVYVVHVVHVENMVELLKGGRPFLNDIPRAPRA